MKITNTHIHTFTTEDIPEKFLPFGLVRLLAKKKLVVARWLLRTFHPLSTKEEIDRYFSFINTAKLDSQKKIFFKCSDEYPIGSRFIILPMDMAYMGAGKVPRNYYDQLEELQAQLPSTAIRFIHVDPRREDMIKKFPSLIQDKGFRGMKLYPPLGIYPYDQRLLPFYAYCEKYKLPVIAHGSPGNPVHYKGSYDELYKLLGVDGSVEPYKSMNKKELCVKFTHPANYVDILLRYPNLNICTAHFGSVHWERYLKNDFNDNWVEIIITMIESYPNFWTDISYTMHDEKYWPMLKVLLLTNEKLRSRVLFGSDFYMNEVEGIEKEWSVNFRAYMGEELFTQLAEINPREFLKEKS
jgi:predicted TIM-barrel fold metal-dependent hydrolase